MRTKTLYKTFKNSDRIRVIVNGVGIYTTVAGVLEVFATSGHSVAAQVCLQKLSDDRLAAKKDSTDTPTGLGTRLTLQDKDYDIQVDLL